MVETNSVTGETNATTTVAVDKRVSSHVAVEPTIVESLPPPPPPAEEIVAVVAGRVSPDRSESAHVDQATASPESQPLATVAAAAANDGHVPHSIIDNWDQLMSTMENSSVVQSDSLHDVTPSAEDGAVTERVADDTTKTAHSAPNDSNSEAAVDDDSSVLNGQYSTNNELSKSLKRPLESEDNVANYKLRPVEINFDPSMSKVNILEPPTESSNNTDGMELTENDDDNMSSIDEAEKESLSDESEMCTCDTVDLVSDSEENNSGSELDYESDVSIDTPSDDNIVYGLPNELLDHNLTDLKNKCLKKYPRLLELVNKEGVIAKELGDLCRRRNILDNWMRQYQISKGPSLNFIIDREKKWQSILKKVSRRLKESLFVLSHYEKYMEKIGHVDPYVVKKTVDLRVEFHSEKEENFQSLLKECVGDYDFDSTGPSCSNTLEQKQISAPNIKQSPSNFTANNSNTTDLSEEKDNGLCELDLDKQPLKPKQSEPSVTPTVCHPVKLPSFPKHHMSYESGNKLPPSPTLIVQNCPELRDQKAVVLRWNLNMNEKEFTEIMCYQIFSYEVIASEEPASEELSNSLWEKITEVHALPLPMKCTLSFGSLKSGQKHYFAIRAVDKYFRWGPFSSIQFIELN